MAKKAASKSVASKPSPWIAHVQAYRSAHGCSLKEAMHGASKTWKKAPTAKLTKANYKGKQGNTSKQQPVHHDASGALGIESWSDVITNQADEQARDLHVMRWGLVYNMLDVYKQNNVSHKLSITHRPKARPSSFEETVCQKIKPIANVTCYKSNKKIWILDMSFGSIEKLSDLDMSMRFYDVLDFKNMSQALIQSRNKYVREGSLSYTLDMQLYADICTDHHLVPIILKNPKAYMCPPEDVGALVSLLTRISVAYLEEESVDLHAWAAEEKWPQLQSMIAYPNPKSIQEASQEDALLATTALASAAFQKKKTFQWYVLLSALKTEGLIHPVSLAAAGVYNGDFIKAIDQTNILLGMYEFVLNLLMHRKRKYVTRMMNIYKSADWTCKTTIPLLKKIADGIARSFSDADDVRLAGSVATYIVNDFRDGEKCAQTLPFADMPSLFKKLLERLVTDPRRRKEIEKSGKLLF